MEEASLSYRESFDPNEAEDLSLLDPDTPFPEVRYLSDDAKQRWFIINLAEKAAGYFSTVWPEKPVIYQFFICPDVRRKGIGAAAARMIVRDLLAQHQAVSLSAVDDVSYQFWCRALHEHALTEEGDTISIRSS